MKIYTTLYLFILLLLSGCEQITSHLNNNEGSKKKSQFKRIKVDYPKSYRDSSIYENYHGKKIYDPYRWMEDAKSAATEEWINAQNQLTFNYLSQIETKAAIAQRLEELWEEEKSDYTLPDYKAENFYYVENQHTLYGMKSPEEEAVKVLNVKDYTTIPNARLGAYSYSADGTILAFEIVDPVTGWGTILVKDIIEDELLEDSLNWIRDSHISWFRDGFFYSRYPEPDSLEISKKMNEFHQVYYHKVGTLQEDDELVFTDRTHPEWKFWAKTTSDERFLVVTVKRPGTGNALYFKNLRKEELSLTPIVEHFKYDFEVIDNVGNYFLILTNYRAPNKRILRVISTYPSSRYWEEVIPEEPDILQEAALVDGKIVGTYLHNATSEISIFDRRGYHLNTFEMPEKGTISHFKGNKNTPVAFYEFSSFTQPPALYHFNLDSMSARVFKAPTLDFDSEAYTTKQLWFKSYDGERVPVFVTHKKDLELDGQRPTLLYGYGGFGIPILPQFNLTRLHLAAAFLENDGVFAVANIRGDGEFGELWHLGAMKAKKQNAFNDFQVAADFLISQRYTSPEKLAIYGKSNGGLVIGACITQRPDLCAVAISDDGVLDMLRYDQFPNGQNWTGEYGQSKIAKDFDYLVAYSPLHNILPAQYPATFISANHHNQQVFPTHSYKFTAELQANQLAPNPVLIRVAFEPSTNAQIQKAERIKKATDILAFTFYQLKEEVYQ